MKRHEDVPFQNIVVSFLAGPVIWSVHFLVVYGLGEIVCTGGWLQTRVLGMPSVTFVTLVLTVAATAAALFAAARAYGARAGPHGELQFMAALLAVVFAVAIVFVGLPPAFLDPC